MHNDLRNNIKSAKFFSLLLSLSVFVSIAGFVVHQNPDIDSFARGGGGNGGDRGGKRLIVGNGSDRNGRSGGDLGGNTRSGSV